MVAPSGCYALCGIGPRVLSAGVGSMGEKKFANRNSAFDGGEHEKRPAVFVGEIRV